MMEKIGLGHFLVLTGQNGTGLYLGKQNEMKYTADNRQIRNGVFASLLHNFLDLSSEPAGDILTLYGDSKVNIIPFQKTVPVNCRNCIELGTVCDACSGKSYIVIEPALRPCDSCLAEKRFSALKAAVVCVSDDPFERKEEQSDPLLSMVSPIQDSLHVVKRKRQSFLN